MEKVQKKENTIQKKDKNNNNGEISQLVSSTPLMLKKSSENQIAFGRVNTLQKKENNTGLPDNLKSGIESLSGHSMEDVNVHYNSSQPAQLNAHAFAQGSDIHVASGQEKHLAHEVWHVVQQKQGRVQPNRQMKGEVNVNDDEGLEHEADVMGEKALQMKSLSSDSDKENKSNTNSFVVQKFEADEHKKLGGFEGIADLKNHIETAEGKKWLKKLGYTDKQIRLLNIKIKQDPALLERKLKTKKALLSYGDATLLMGDLFGHVNRLINAPQSMVDEMKDAKSTADYQKASNGNYLKLAKKNSSHFGREAKQNWEELHLEAISDAYFSDNEAFELAMVKENAAAHFMTDAFSSGHLFDKNTLLAHILIYLERSKDVASTTGLSTMANIIKSLGKEEYSQLIVKIIHDELNKNGFDIENGRGWRWRAYGDNHLKESAEHQNTITLAVFESRTQIIKARNKKITPKEVEHIGLLFPSEQTIVNAEQKAISLIPKAVKKLPELLPTFGKDTMAGIGKIPFLNKIPIIGDISPYILSGLIRGGLKSASESDNADSLKLNFMLNDMLFKKGKHNDVYLQYEHRFDEGKRDSKFLKDNLSLNIDF